MLGADAADPNLVGFEEFEAELICLNFAKFTDYEDSQQTPLGLFTHALTGVDCDRIWRRAV